MSTTPGKLPKPRQSAIPTPGRSSALPTPSRSRSSSVAAEQRTNSQDVDYAYRAFAEAIKSNDPARHRLERDSAGAGSSPSRTAAYSSSTSGRRSVTGRPSSAASSSSAVSLRQSRPAAERPQTPSYARPSSRQSDHATRSFSRAGRAFEPGDSVRIESLGFEGVLRYVGEIDGKPGLWAGVELGGGFAGKGKNDGSVGGKQYFTCPARCGVFVATTKLSAPTVPGRKRPSSVASSGSGRATPSFSGTTTPASTPYAKGRLSGVASTAKGRPPPPQSGGSTQLPNGRVTPGTRRIARPSNAASIDVAPPPVRNGSSSVESKITAGSRASKYIGMTARDLNSRTSVVPSVSKSDAAASPTRSSVGTPRSLTSPEPPSSPFSTPRPGPTSRMSNLGVGSPTSSPSKGRLSLGTPRARVPSAVAMPPPASPSSPSRSNMSADGELLYGGDSDHGKGLQPNVLSSPSSRGHRDLYPQSMSGNASPSRYLTSPRPGSATSSRSTSDQYASLSARIEFLQSENESLHARLESRAAEALESAHRAEMARDEALARVVQLESQFKTAERSLNERDSKVDSLERTLQQVTTELNHRKTDGDSVLGDLQSKLDDANSLVASLKEALDAKQDTESQHDAVLQARAAEISLLQARVDKADNELRDVRSELGAQVDELRQAGQETIALYEERLSVAEAQCRELEDQLSSVNPLARSEARLGASHDSNGPKSAADEIDNDMLRDQISHLQHKIVGLEDALEDLRVTSEKEDVSSRERIARLKERDEVIKKELSDNRRELEKMVKSESEARSRVEEVEEALRECTAALEGSQAEVETLRNEMADRYDAGLKGSVGPSRQPAGASDEVEQLRRELDLLKSSKRTADDELESMQERVRQLSATPDDTQASLSSAEQEQRTLDRSREEMLQQLEDERLANAELREALQGATAELDSVKRKSKREVSINNGFDSAQSPPISPSSSKHDLLTAKEEIKGLKHIVQDLQKENTTNVQRNKLLESENRLLLSETDQLREDLKLLEDNIDQSILREEQALSAKSPAKSPRRSADGSSALEAELESLKKRLVDAEMKNARTIHDMNKEITELEALVESKIYREDELERELERAREKLARSQRKSKSSIETIDSTRRLSTASSTATSADTPEGVCEICERPGHDIFTCDLLQESTPSAGSVPAASKPPAASGDGSGLYCEDCDSYGHVAAECPHSADVF